MSTSTTLSSSTINNNNHISHSTFPTQDTNLTLSSSSTTPPGLPKDSKILCINFNQDQGCFAIGHEQGFSVYNSNPIELRVKRKFSSSYTNNGNTNLTYIRSNSNGSQTSAKSLIGGSGIGKITMLHRTNYLALVGGGNSPKYPPNKLIIWDDLKRKSSLSLEFNQPIINVLLSRIKIIVILLNQITVYGFSAPPKKFVSFETIDNEFGLGDLSITSVSSSDISDGSNSTILAIPGKIQGQIQIVDISKFKESQQQSITQIDLIKAHKSKIRNFCLNKSGSLLASASVLGTIIRIHSTKTTNLLYEFRRGIDKADITSLKFNNDDTKLAVLSDKNTLHIYNLINDNNSSNKQHFLNKFQIPYLPQYFKSTWSYVSLNIAKYHENFNHLDLGVIGWNSDDSIIIVWKLQRLWEKYEILPLEGNMSNDNYEIVRTSWKSLDNED